MPVTQYRLNCILDALADLETVFADPEALRSPGSYDPRHIQEYAVALASEFMGDYRDDELTAQLAKLVDAEDAEDARRAAQHLRWTKRRIATRWTTPQQTSP